MSSRMGSMNLEEFLKGFTSETEPSPVIETGNGNGSSVSKIEDETVWRENIKREPWLGEMTLEDFLTKEGAIDESPLMPLDVGASTSHQLGLSPAPSISAPSDTPVSGRKRHPSDKFVEKKLKRKIKNRESAARSRARKQAYHNDLVSKVSSLEELNMRLKKDREIDTRFSTVQPRFQLRRTTSATF